MQTRKFGRSGLEISILGFGCGAVGGLMVRGDPADQERTVARALEAGVNYFDTAVQYGEGASEQNLGRVLKQLKPTAAIIGTKVRLRPSELNRVTQAVTRSLEGSLQRLGLDRVDIFYLHNDVTIAGGGESLRAEQVLEEVVPAFTKLRERGMTRFLGLTAIGETRALHQVIDAGVVDSAQVVYNLLNASAAVGLPRAYPAQDYGGMLERTTAAGVGVVAIRVLAGGALSGSTARHPTASPAPAPIGSATTYATDVRRAQRFMPLIEAGFAETLTEAATRFALSHPAIATILVGIATPAQFEQALASVQKGPLPAEALSLLGKLQETLVGEAR